MQGDTLQNVEKELDKILETGCYSFKIIEGEVQMILELIPHGSRTSYISEESMDSETAFKAEPKPVELDMSNGKAPKQKQWNSEQIGDFVRKLGFMDTEKKGGEKIKHFRHISTVSVLRVLLYCCSSFNVLNSQRRFYIGMTLNS